MESRSYYDPLPCDNEIYKTSNPIHNARRLSETNLAIPCNQYLTDAQINNIIKLINDFV